ncbi:MAG: DUF1566 domain-containing protein [Deltaproteobacteria bacterium]|nr:DUF1566 domain-containing protein [Deltaproteobacteria bacterium]
MRYTNGMVLGVLLLSVTAVAWAGSLDDIGAPTSADSAMYTLEDVYNRLNSNTQATKRSGAFTEPSAGPDSTGHTLDQVYEKAIPTQVPKTGQTTSYRTHDDGDLEKGVTWPSPRFTDNEDGTVTDNLTGLIWLKNANCAGGTVNWNTAVDYCAALYDGCTGCFGGEADCGLSDGSVAGDWRLPNAKELHSLIDFGQYNPALPSGNPFTGVQSYHYWTSSTYGDDTDYAWYVHLYYGRVYCDVKTRTYYVWPVRGGQ